MKKTYLALVLILAVLATCMVGCGLFDSTATIDSEKETAAAVFTLDVNPGVRIYVRSDDSVIAVEATNEDGEEVVAEIEIEGKTYEDVVEEIIDEMEENGYIDGEENSILISVEKKVKDISDKVNEKIEKAFEKHGKKASIIEQELDELNEETKKEIIGMEEKYHISRGKAHLIEKIREEFPELSEEELAKLNVNDLRLMLEETSDDIKEHFKKIDEPARHDYVEKDEALSKALESIEASAEDITMSRVRITHGHKKMLYLVEFVYNGMEYEITVDCKTGEILETESREYVEINPDDIIDDFCNKHNISPDEIKDHVNNIFGNDENKDDHKGDHNDPKDDPKDDPSNDNKEEDNGENVEDLPDEKPLTKSEILKAILEKFEISDKALKRTDVKLHHTENGTVFSVTIINNSDAVYKFIVEAYSGVILKAELNGAEFDLAAITTE